MDERLHRRLVRAQGRSSERNECVIQESIFGIEANRVKIELFLDSDGPPKIMVYYQTPDTGSENDHNVIDPTLFLTYGDTERIKDKAVWFLRNLPENKKKVTLWLLR